MQLVYRGCFRLCRISSRAFHAPARSTIQNYSSSREPQTRNDFIIIDLAHMSAHILLFTAFRSATTERAAFTQPQIYHPRTPRLSGYLPRKRPAASPAAPVPAQERTSSLYPLKSSRSDSPPSEPNSPFSNPIILSTSAPKS
jgi:hypothetical protein